MALPSLDKWLLAAGAASVALLLSSAGSLSAASAPQLMAQAAPTPAGPGASSAAPEATETRGPVALVELQISRLHKRLHITAGQEQEFNAFAAVMRDNAKTMQDLFHERAQHRDRTAPGQLHWYAQLTTTHAEGLNKLVPAFDTLYQTLSPAQQKDADVAFRPLRQGRPARRHG